MRRPTAICRASARRTARSASLFDFCERVDPAQSSRAAIETLIKAGAFDSLGAKRSQLMAVVDRAMQAGAAAAADRRSGQKGPVRRRSTSRRPEPRDRSTLARPARVGRTRAAGHRKGSARLLPHAAIRWPSTSRRWPPIARTPRPKSAEPAAPHRSHARRHALGDQVFAHQEPASRAAPRQVRHVRPGRHRTELMRCIIWPEQFANYGHLVQADAIAGRARRGRPPAGQRGSQPDRQRVDPAGRPTRAVHQGHRDSRQRGASHGSADSNNCTKSCAAIRAVANCSWCSAWPTAAGRC